MSTERCVVTRSNDAKQQSRTHHISSHFHWHSRIASLLCPHYHCHKSRIKYPELRLAIDNVLIFESPLGTNAWLHGKRNRLNNVKRLGTPWHYHFIQMHLHFKEDSNESLEERYCIFVLWCHCASCWMSFHQPQKERERVGLYFMYLSVIIQDYNHIMRIFNQSLKIVSKM